MPLKVARVKETREVAAPVTPSLLPPLSHLPELFNSKPAQVHRSALNVPTHTPSGVGDDRTVSRPSLGVERVLGGFAPDAAPDVGLRESAKERPELRARIGVELGQPLLVFEGERLGLAGGSGEQAQDG